jgi:hypothetical protein
MNKGYKKELMALVQAVRDRSDEFLTTIANKENPQVKEMCVRNEGRLEMAEAILQAMRGDMVMIKILGEKLS